MTRKRCTAELPVLRVDGDQVILGGQNATADGKGAHDLLQPVVHVGDLNTAHPVEPGDIVRRFDDGSCDHIPMQQRDS